MIKHADEAEAGTGIITVHEVAQYLRMSEAKIYQMARAGELPAIRIGKTWRFKRKMIDEWFQEKIGIAKV